MARNRFVAVGNSISCYSDDGITWTSATVPIGSGTWNRVIHDGTQFIAVGTNIISTSPDGDIWTSGSIPTGAWRDLAYNGSVYVVCANGTVGQAVSSDLTSWTTYSAPTSGTNLWHIVWASGAGVFILRRTSFNGTSFQSPDGVTWTAGGAPGTNAAGRMATDGTQVLQVLTVNASINLRTVDGTSWATRSNTGAYQSVTHHDGLWVVVGTDLSGSGGVASTVRTSPDTTTWTTRMSSVNFADVAAGGGTYIAVGSNVAAYSIGGTSWSTTTIPTGAWTACAWGPAKPRGRRGVGALVR